MTQIAFDPLDAAQREDPFPVLELARRERPVFHAPQFDLWVVTRHDDVLAVLKDHDDQELATPRLAEVVGSDE